MNSIFVLSAVYFDSQEQYYFFGPENITQDDFIKLCNSLLDEAANNAISFELKKDEPEFIGIIEIINAIKPLLQNKGFILFNPKTASYFGPGILDS